MAITKKAAEAAQKKQQQREAILVVQQRLKAALNRVPTAVLNGSHQMAVAWKESAHAAHTSIAVNSPPGGSLSLAELEVRRAKLEAKLSELEVA